MINKKLQDMARAIDRARRSVRDPNYQMGINYAAHALADDHCTTAERYHFFLMCGVPFSLYAEPEK